MAFFMDQGGKNSKNSKGECTPSNVVDLDGDLERVDLCQQSLLKQVQEAYAPKAVKINTVRDGAQKGEGSGFFVNDGTQIVTAAHVVNGTRTIEIVAADGQKYQGKVLSIDDVNDQAVIQALGMKPDPSRAVDTSQSSELYPGARVVGVGSPGGEKDTFLSPGFAQAKATMGDIVEASGGAVPGQPGRPKSVNNLVYDALNSRDANEVDDAGRFLLSKRIVTNSVFHGGQSGGLVVGEDLKFAGMIQSRNQFTARDGTTQFRGNYVPDDVVRQMLNSPSRFQFDYSMKSEYDLNKSGVTAKLALDGAAPLAAKVLPRVGALAPLGVGLYEASSFKENYRGFFNPAASDQLKSQYGRKLAEDVGYAGGGLAMTIGLIARNRLRPVGLLAGGLAYGAAAVSDNISKFEGRIPYLESAKRKNGDPRNPIMWKPF